MYVLKLSFITAKSTFLRVFSGDPFQPFATATRALDEETKKTRKESYTTVIIITRAQQ